MKISSVVFSSVLIFGFNANSSSTDKELSKTAKALFGIIPTKAAAPDKVSSEQIELGRKIFFDYRLSKDGSTTCVRCHQPQYYSTDRLAQSAGFNNNKGARCAVRARSSQRAG